MKEKFNSLVLKYTPMFKNIMFIIFIGVSLFAGFSAGYTYCNKYGEQKPTIQMIRVNRSQVNLALDEHNHLIIINKKSGDYTVYQDSIGVSIFKLYARDIFTKHSK